MDNETLVKERFDAAVADVSPDVVSLVGGGIAAGRGIRRRRRVQGAVGVLAATAIAAGALTATGTLGNLLDSQGSNPAGKPGRLVELEPATPRGLAAAVMAHTSAVGTLIGVGGAASGQQDPDIQMRGSLTTELAYRTDGGVKVDLQVVVSPQIGVWRRNVDCSSQPKGSCTRKRLADGTTRVVMQEDADGKAPSASGVFSGPHLLAVSILRRDQLVFVIETVVNSGNSPLGIPALQAIATDPAIGVSTTHALNAEGLKIGHFRTSLTSGSSSSSATASAPSGSVASRSAATQGPPPPRSVSPPSVGTVSPPSAGSATSTVPSG